jgi:ACS family hexuronate transporter-like MFS transporter
MSHDTTISTRRSWLLLTLAFLASSLAFLDRQVLSVLAPCIIAEFGISNTVYSRIVSAFVLSYTIMFGLGGRVSDRLGSRRGLGLSVGLWSLASMLHGVVIGPWSLGIARCLLGIGEGPCIPSIVKGAVEWAPPKQRGLAIGFANAGSAFGSLIAPPLSVWLAMRYGWRATFIFMGSLGIAWLVPWCCAVRRLPQPPEPATEQSQVTFRGLLRCVPVQRLLLARFCFDPVFYFYMFWIPQYFASERGMSLEKIGELVWIPFFSLGIANVIAGKLSDMVIARGRKPRDARLLLMLIAAIISPVSWGVAVVDSPAIAIGMMATLMFVHGVWIANYIALISDTVAPYHVGTTVGLSGACGGIAGIVSSLAIGPLVDQFSFTPVFLISAILYPLAWIIIRQGMKPFPKNVQERGE